MPDLPCVPPDKLWARWIWKRALVAWVTCFVMSGFGITKILSAVMDLSLFVSMVHGDGWNPDYEAIASNPSWNFGWDLLQVAAIGGGLLVPVVAIPLFVDRQGGWHELVLTRMARARAVANTPLALCAEKLRLEQRQGAARPEHVIQYAQCFTRPPTDDERVYVRELAELMRELRERAQEGLRHPDDALNPRVSHGGRIYDAAELEVLAERANDALWDVMQPKTASR